MSLPEENSTLRSRMSKRIAFVRDKRGLSQRELGEKLGISQSAVARLERGVANLTLDTIEDTFDALNCDVLFKVVRREKQDEEKKEK